MVGCTLAAKPDNLCPSGSVCVVWNLDRADEDSPTASPTATVSPTSVFIATNTPSPTDDPTPTQEVGHIPSTPTYAFTDYYAEAIANPCLNLRQDFRTSARVLLCIPFEDWLWVDAGVSAALPFDSAVNSRWIYVYHLNSDTYGYVVERLTRRITDIPLVPR